MSLFVCFFQLSKNKMRIKRIFPINLVWKRKNKTSKSFSYNGSNVGVVDHIILSFIWWKVFLRIISRLLVNYHVHSSHVIINKLDHFEKGWKREIKLILHLINILSQSFGLNVFILKNERWELITVHIVNIFTLMSLWILENWKLSFMIFFLFQRQILTSFKTKITIKNNNNKKQTSPNIFMFLSMPYAVKDLT